MIKQGNESPILKIETFPYLTLPSPEMEECVKIHTALKRETFFRANPPEFLPLRHGQLMGCKFYFFGQEQ